MESDKLMKSHNKPAHQALSTVFHVFHVYFSPGGPAHRDVSHDVVGRASEPERMVTLKPPGPAPGPVSGETEHNVLRGGEVTGGDLHRQAGRRR